MEDLSSKIKDIVLSQPPEELLGCLWGKLLLLSLNDSEPSKTPDSEVDIKKTPLLFTLEYVHAILSSFDKQSEGLGSLQEGMIKKLIEFAAKLREVTLLYCMASSCPGLGAEFGDETGLVEFTAKSTWAIIRGNRYQVLEEEFFRFILHPHDEALRQAYRIGADDLAVQELSMPSPVFPVRPAMPLPYATSGSWHMCCATWKRSRRLSPSRR